MRLAVPRRIPSAVTFASPANAGGSASAPPLKVTLNVTSGTSLRDITSSTAPFGQDLPCVRRQPDLPRSRRTRGAEGRNSPQLETSGVGTSSFAPRELDVAIVRWFGPRYFLATRKTSAAVTASYLLGVSYIFSYPPRKISAVPKLIRPCLRWSSFLDRSWSGAGSWLYEVRPPESPWFVPFRSLRTRTFSVTVARSTPARGRTKKMNSLGIQTALCCGLSRQCDLFAVHHSGVEPRTAAFGQNAESTSSAGISLSAAFGM